MTFEALGQGVARGDECVRPQRDRRRRVVQAHPLECGVEPVPIDPPVHQPGRVGPRDAEIGERVGRRGHRQPGSVPADSPEDGIHRAGRAGAAALAGQPDGVVDDGGGRDAIEMEQLVRRQPQDVEDVGVERADGPAARPRDRMVERRAPPQRAECNLCGERLVALVSEAPAAVFERGREIGVPRMHAAQRVKGHHARDSRHRRQAAPAGRAGGGAPGGRSNRTSSPPRWPAAKSRAVIARRPSG